MLILNSGSVVDVLLVNVVFVIMKHLLSLYTF